MGSHKTTQSPSKTAKRSENPTDHRSTLKQVGLRKTAPRVAVLQFLESATAPVSHAEIADQLAPQGYDRATVYRNLTDLTDAGLVARTDLGDHIWRFELKTKQQSHRGSQHPHFVCTDCGDVSCLPPLTVKVTAARGVPRSLTQDKVEVQIKGKCDTCSSQ